MGLTAIVYILKRVKHISGKMIMIIIYKNELFRANFRREYQFNEKLMNQLLLHYFTFQFLYGPPQVKCRLLISSIFDAKNF